MLCPSIHCRNYKCVSQALLAVLFALPTGIHDCKLSSLINGTAGSEREKQIVGKLGTNPSAPGTI